MEWLTNGLTSCSNLSRLLPSAAEDRRDQYHSHADAPALTDARDGVLPYAPDSSYGRPEDLMALVDAAHWPAARWTAAPPHSLV
ncbi:hypothetical protein [Neorhizobium sp. P12A]|uniref:hypothetical protein n=1 Tax=Neorhizobium sp. P12A TaxID=2268027 RepID=UPI0011EEA667|nr:hypothetical protein [Neorhizobium sp. P12A]